MEQVKVVHITDINNGTAYHLSFPLSELANCIALCGWTITNDIEKTNAVRAEIARLDELDGLDIPDGREWFAKYGTRYNVYEAENYKAKQEEKRERYEELADKAKRESESRYNSAHQMMSFIPLGQPILVGHHSERRHRRDLNRIDANMRAGIEADGRAKHYERKAESYGQHGIQSEDPEAVIKLKDELTRHEALQERMKSANKVVKNKKLTDDQKVAELALQNISEDAARQLLKPDFGGRIGFANYMLTNNSANIRRIKERIEKLSQAQETPETVIKSENGIRLEDCPADNRVRLFFPGKPSEEIRSRLKANGFRWSPTIGAWQAYRNYRSNELAKQMIAA